MSTRSRIAKRYSLAFKRKVVSEIESGQLTITSARKRYGIGGKMTISKWIKKFGKNDLLGKVVRIATTGEVNALEKENRRLESALAQAHLKIVALEGIIDEASSFYHTDLKKSFDIQT